MAALQYQPSSLLCPTNTTISVTSNNSLVFSSSSTYSPSQRTRIPPLSLTTKPFNLQLPKRRIPSSFRCFSALNPALKTTIDKVVTSNKVVLFMKGNKDFPQCGFSNTVVQILKSLDVPFETLDILENELLRQALKEYSNWPTFPQLYIDGEFFGGCDITVGKWERNKYFGAPLVGKTSSDSKLIQHENITATPQLGASTMEAQEAALKRELSATAVNAPLVPAEALRAAAVVFWSALILIFAHPFIASRAYATVQTAANPGGSGVAAVALGGWFVRTELLSSAWTGFFAGCLHTLSGPDHLAALAPLSIGRSRLESAAVGALWGCGHDAGQVIFGLLFLLLKDRLHIEILRTWGTRVVGLTLLVIGAMGIKEATEVPAPCVALENGECDVDVLNSLENPPKKKIGFATFATGIIHGLQPDALMMVLPALALPSRLAGAAFLGMFLLGTVFSMGSYTVFIGSCSQALKERIPRITEKLTWASSLIAIALGFAILISQFFGYSLY